MYTSYLIFSSSSYSNFLLLSLLHLKLTSSSSCIFPNYVIQLCKGFLETFPTLKFFTFFPFFLLLLVLPPLCRRPQWNRPSVTCIGIFIGSSFLFWLFSTFSNFRPVFFSVVPPLQIFTTAHSSFPSLSFPSASVCFAVLAASSLYFFNLVPPLPLKAKWKRLYRKCIRMQLKNKSTV